MNALLYYSLSFILAAIVHGLVFALVVTNWQSEKVDIQDDNKRYYIESSVVSENPNRAKADRKKYAVDQRKKTRIKRRAAQDAKRQAAIERERLQIEALKKQSERQANEESDKNSRVPVENVAQKEEEHKRRAEALDLAIADEQLALRAITDDEKAQAFAAQIKQDIIQNWSRPPSARNGMQAILRVYLVPTGEVVSVSIDESSGNDAFDRSAIFAVNKVGRFTVPANSRQFEKNFRQFIVLFKPEDLRL